MADNKIEFEVSVAGPNTKDLQAGKAAVEGISKSGAAMDKALKPSAWSMRDIGLNLRAIGREARGIPGLSQAFHFLRHPVIAAGLAIGMAVGKIIEWKGKLDESRALMVEIADHAGKMGRAFQFGLESKWTLESFARGMAEIVGRTRTATEELERFNKEAGKDIKAKGEIRSERLKTEMSEIDRREKMGIITPEKAAELKAKAEMRESETKRLEALKDLQGQIPMTEAAAKKEGDKAAAKTAEAAALTAEQEALKKQGSGYKMLPGEERRIQEEIAKKKDLMKLTWGESVLGETSGNQAERSKISKEIDALEEQINQRASTVSSFDNAAKVKGEQATKANELANAAKERQKKLIEEADTQRKDLQRMATVSGVQSTEEGKRAWLASHPYSSSAMGTVGTDPALIAVLEDIRNNTKPNTNTFDPNNPFHRNP